MKTNHPSDQHMIENHGTSKFHETKICADCGMMQAHDASYCSHCGSNRFQDPATMSLNESQDRTREGSKCPNCGEPVDVDTTKYCMNCGMQVCYELEIPVTMNNSKQGAGTPENLPGVALPRTSGQDQASRTTYQEQAGTHRPGYHLVNGRYIDRTTAGLLALLLGTFGVQMFYLGKIGKGILCIIFSWTVVPLIIGIIEGILYLRATDAEFYQKYCP